MEDANELNNLTHSQKIEDLERRLLPTGITSETPGADEFCPMIHLFSPGIYIRGILMRAGRYIIGHEHKTEHFNFVLNGKALVDIDGVQHLIEAPSIFKSEPGVRKVLIILEDMRWVTVHPNPTDERDLKKLDEMFVAKSATWLEHHERLAEQQIGTNAHLPSETPL